VGAEERRGTVSLLNLHTPAPLEKDWAPQGSAWPTQPPPPTSGDRIQPFFQPASLRQAVWSTKLSCLPWLAWADTCSLHSHGSHCMECLHILQNHGQGPQRAFSKGLPLLHALGFRTVLPVSTSCPTKDLQESRTGGLHWQSVRVALKSHPTLQGHGRAHPAPSDLPLPSHNGSLDQDAEFPHTL
jgi:hypothetical protein